MKTFGRIVIILVVFALVMGVTYFVVNASGNSSNGMPQFENRERPQFANGERPEFPGGGRPEGRERGGGGWMFGLIKNVGVLALLVMIIVWPRSVAKKKRKQAEIKSANVET